MSGYTNQTNYMRILLIVLFSVFTVEYTVSGKIKNNVKMESDNSRIVIDTLSFSLKNLDYVLQHYNVKHRDIVIRQFILETGWGTSYSFKHRNNLFGLYNSRDHQYFEFNHWSESVKGYKDLVQYKYEQGDYYDFLINLPYAEDSSYIEKLKSIKYDL